MGTCDTHLQYGVWLLLLLLSGFYGTLLATALGFMELPAAAMEVGGNVVVVLLDQQRLGPRVQTIVTEHVADQVHQGGLAVVAALAVHEEEDLLGHDSRERVCPGGQALSF